MAQKKSIALAEEQRKFIDKALSGKNFMLDGAEGSGKRTAIKELCAQIPSKNRVLYFTNSRFFKNEVESGIKNSNVSVEYYSGFAFRELRKVGIYGEPEDLVEMFAKVSPIIKGYDYLIIAEFEDLSKEASKMLEVIKSHNPNIKIIAYGDVTHKVFEEGVFNARDFMEGFLDKYEKFEFRNCYLVSDFDRHQDDGNENDTSDESDDNELTIDLEDKDEDSKSEHKRKKADSKKSSSRINETKFAVIDTEINKKDEVMSIGLVVADVESFEIVEEKYFILEPEHSVGGEYSKALRINEFVNVRNYKRAEAIKKIQSCLKGYGIRSVFAYNATADYLRLPELNDYDWYDIMLIAAYKQNNPAITEQDECHESGRLRRNFGVADMIYRLSGEKCTETHNALYDAKDELKVMVLLNRSVNDYVEAILRDAGTGDDAYWQDLEISDMEPDSLTAAEAAKMLGTDAKGVQDLIKSGEITGYKRGRHIIVNERSVKEYIARQEAKEDFRYKTTLSSICLAISFALLYLLHMYIGLF